MRKKEDCVVLTFDSTTDAMIWEDIARKNGFEGRLIPIPSVIKAGCGVCWKEPIRNIKGLKINIKENKINYQEIIEINL